MAEDPAEQNNTVEFGNRIWAGLRSFFEKDNAVKQSRLSVTVFFVVLFVIALVFSGLASGYAAGPSSIFLSLTWAISSSVAGGAMGFLFGLPKVLQTDEPRGLKGGAGGELGEPEQSNYRQIVNTNLTEISDWITKIIVGLGLVNLTVIPGKLYRLSEVVGVELSRNSNQPAVALAMAILVGFAVLGFLYGYLATRMYLASALAHADREAISTQTRVQSNKAEIDSVRGELAMLKAQLNPLSSVPANLVDTATPPKTEAEHSSPAEPNVVAGNLRARNDIEMLVARYENLRALGPERLQVSFREYTRQRDRVADELAALCSKELADRDWLAASAAEKSSDGFAVALAGVVNSAPEPQDVPRLLRVAAAARSNHTRYRICRAIGRLYSSKLATSAHLPETVRILQEYKQGTNDASLKEQVTRTAALISDVLGVGFTV
jgi:hypothetical protein